MPSRRAPNGTLRFARPCGKKGLNLLAGDVDTGKAVLRDYINAMIGFEELSRVFD